MSEINWQCIADAIRERRFQDIPPEAWNLIADKIEGNPVAGRNKTKKLGRPPKTKWPEFPSQEWRDCADKYGDEWVNAYCEANDNLDSDIYKRAWAVLERYNELREQGVSKGEAQIQMSIEQGMPGLKTIEAILTNFRHTTTWNAKTKSWEKIPVSELKLFLPYG